MENLVAQASRLGALRTLHGGRDARPTKLCIIYGWAEGPGRNAAWNSQYADYTVDFVG